MGFNWNKTNGPHMVLICIGKPAPEFPKSLNKNFQIRFSEPEFPKYVFRKHIFQNAVFGTRIFRILFFVPEVSHVQRLKADGTPKVQLRRYKYRAFYEF